MARARPEKVKQVLDTFKQLGPLATFRKVMNRLDSMTPLGYSLAGKIIEKGEGVTDLEVGDMVACGGGELATHSEINWIPANLCVKIPTFSAGPNHGDIVPPEQAAFATVGAIAMQGVRQARVQVGENVAVIGLGLVGLLACQILRAAGCRVIGFDIDQRKVELARSMGVDAAANSGDADPVQLTESFSGGYGADVVLVTTGTQSNEPIEIAGMIARDRATVVDIGINRMDVPWKLYYAKELQLRQSRSYGPGRYDPAYEMAGHDYPIGYVRWTERRNMQSVLELIASGRLDVTPLITHRFAFDEAEDAYALISSDANEFYVGVMLEYDVTPPRLANAWVDSVSISSKSSDGNVGLGVIGAGNFARTMLLPHLKSAKDVDLISVAAATGISARDTARKFGFDSCTTDYHKVLTDPTVDAVVIATRHDLHGPIVLQALEHGKHVYTEKPLCLDEEMLRKIGAVYRDLASAGTAPVLTVGFNRRHSPMIRKVKDFFSGRTQPMVMSYRVNAGHLPPDSWYQDPEVGGGRIVGEVCHFVDTLQYLSDATPVRVTAHSVRSDNRAMTPADNVIVSITFSDGSVGSITYLANGDPAYPKEYLEVFAEQKVAALHNFTRLVTMAGGREKVTRSPMQDKGHKTEMREFLDSVTGRQAPSLSFPSIFSTTLTTFRILESLQSRTTVDVEPWD
jgi:polar amino acid transport system substrate-binding protein